MKKIGRTSVTNIGRVFSGGVRGFFRNSWLSGAAILVMTATLSVALLTMISFVVYGKQVKRLADKVDVKIFLKNEVTDQQMNSFEAYVKSLKGVKSVTVRTKTQAIEDYKQINKDNPSALRALELAGDQINLPASFSVKIEDFESVDMIQDSINNSEYKTLMEQSDNSGDKLRANKNIANSLKTIRKIGMIASLVLGSVSMLIIVNTIRLAIFNRKDEIEIMRLIGASKIYIKGPFLVEASVYGAVAGVLAYVLMRLTVFGLKGKAWVGDVAGDISVFTDHGLWVFLGVVSAGILVGFVAAQFAIRKYVRTKSY
jgi:cell division transport system permease protein